MSGQNLLPFISFEEMRRSLGDEIRASYTEPRSIHSRIQVINGSADLKIQVRDSHGTPNGITVSERSDPNDSWSRTTLNLGLLGTQGEVQLTLPSDGMHPRPHMFVDSIDQLPPDSSALLSRGIALLRNV